MQNALPSLKNLLPISVQPCPENIPVSPSSEPQIGTSPDEQAGVPKLHCICPLEQCGKLPEEEPELPEDENPPELDEDELELLEELPPLELVELTHPASSG